MTANVHGLPGRDNNGSVLACGARPGTKEARIGSDPVKKWAKVGTLYLGLFSFRAAAGPTVGNVSTFGIDIPLGTYPSENYALT